MAYKNLKSAKKDLSLKDFRRLHENALQAVDKLQESELNLIKTLQIIENNMVHRWCGYNSLFEYCVQCLKLSRSQSYMYMSLAKSLRKYHKLNRALNNKTVTPSKAARVLAVMNIENEEEWILKAATLPKSQLEKEVVRLNPKKVRGERSEYLTSDVIEMKIPVSEDVYKQLIRVQDLLSDSQGKAMTMEEVFSHLVKDYLQRKDPVQKAQRNLHINPKNKRTAQLRHQEAQDQLLGNPTAQVNQQIVLNKRNKNSQKDHMPPPVSSIVPSSLKSSLKPQPSEPFEYSSPATNSRGQRLAIPAEILHQVHLRDRGRCQHHYPSGERCRATRWLHKHHRLPVSQGGHHSVENIISLCPAHHELAHILLESKNSDESLWGSTASSVEQSLPGQIFKAMEF